MRQINTPDMGRYITSVRLMKNKSLYTEVCHLHTKDWKERNTVATKVLKNKPGMKREKAEAWEMRVLHNSPKWDQVALFFLAPLKSADPLSGNNNADLSNAIAQCKKPQCPT